MFLKVMAIILSGGPGQHMLFSFLVGLQVPAYVPCPPGASVQFLLASASGSAHHRCHLPPPHTRSDPWADAASESLLLRPQSSTPHALLPLPKGFLKTCFEETPTLPYETYTHPIKVLLYSFSHEKFTANFWDIHIRYFGPHFVSDEYEDPKSN
jgi:hypothetical protein